MLKINKASTVLNLIISMVICAIVVNISLQAYFRLIKIFIRQKELTYVLDGAITAFYNMRFDFANSGKFPFKQDNVNKNNVYKNIVKQNNNKNSFVNRHIDLCFNSVGSCIDIVPDSVLNIIKQRKLLLNSNIVTIYNVPYLVGNLEANTVSKAEPICFTSANTGVSIKEGNIIIISYANSSDKYESFIVSGITKGCLEHDAFYNDTNNLFNLYNSGALIYKLQHITYYVALNEKNVMCLYRLVWGEKSDAIADGIQAFNVSALQGANNAYNLKLKFSNVSVEKEFIFKLRYVHASAIPQ